MSRAIDVCGRMVAMGAEPFVIAEIGVNHDGSVSRARELVRAARDAGADAAKFQMFDADMLMSRDAVLAAYQRANGARDPRELLRGLQLPVDALGALAEECRAIGIAPMVTVFSLPLFAHARVQPWAAFKTASPDIVNLPLLRAAMSMARAARRPMISSILLAQIPVPGRFTAMSAAVMNAPAAMSRAATIDCRLTRRTSRSTSCSTLRLDPTMRAARRARRTYSANCVGSRLAA